MNVQEKIIEVIDTLRPYIINEGGNIEFVKYEDNIVYIKMLGACAECDLIDFTITDVIEQSIKEEVNEIKAVVNLSE